MEIADRGITTMSQDSQRPSSHSERLNQEVSDGGGCAETWEAMSEMREESDRRDFLTHVGATLGVLATGGTAATMSAAAHDNGSASDGDGEVKELRGRERDQLLRRANQSTDVRQVAALLGEKPDPVKVFEYKADGDSSYGVTFGDPEIEGTTIEYRSPSLDGEGVAHGGRPIGDGLRVVETKEGSMMSIGTQHVENALSRIPDTVDASNGTLVREQSILVQALDGSAFDLYVPVVSDDDVVDRLVFSAKGSPADADQDNLVETSGQASEGISINGHVGCGPFGVVCTDYCTVLCGSLGAGASAGCAGACASTVAGLPISVGCGAICGAVVAGTCYQTCKNNTGHDVT